MCAPFSLSAPASRSCVAAACRRGTPRAAVSTRDRSVDGIPTPAAVRSASARARSPHSDGMRDVKDSACDVVDRGADCPPARWDERHADRRARQSRARRTSVRPGTAARVRRPSGALASHFFFHRGVQSATIVGKSFACNASSASGTGWRRRLGAAAGLAPASGGTLRASRARCRWPLWRMTNIEKWRRNAALRRWRLHTTASESAAARLRLIQRLADTRPTRFIHPAGDLIVDRRDPLSERGAVAVGSPSGRR